jgi:hypothetical protein
MKTLLALLLTLPALASAEELQFTVTGSEANGTPFGMSFLVDTMAPGNSLTDTFNADGSLKSVAASLQATDFSATLNGVTIETGGVGTFVFNGSQLGLCTFIGGAYGAGTAGAAFGGSPDFALAGGGCLTQPELAASPDPLALMLTDAAFSGDSLGQSNFGGQYSSGAGDTAAVHVTAASVPEPGPLGLLTLGLGALLLIDRRRT